MMLVGVVLTGIVTAIVTGLFSPPRYVPATIYQGKNGSEPQTIAELTKESQTCDEAIRSLLLAFANEVQGPDPSTPTDAVQKTRALVDTDLAIVPTACQKLIDPISVQSAKDLRVSVLSIKSYANKITGQLTIENVGAEPVFVAFERSTYDKNIRVTDNRSNIRYSSSTLNGVFSCWDPCSNSYAHKFTRIDPGAKASVTIQSSATFASGYGEAKTVSVSFTLLTSADGEIGESLSFGFNDVPVNQ